MKLAEGIKTYVTFKRASGLDFTQAERDFRRFSSHVGNCDLADISTGDVAGFLGPPADQLSSWHAKYLRLRKFFDYWFFMGAMGRILMPPRPVRACRSGRPYVYSLAEIKRLLEATVECQRDQKQKVDAETLRMFLTLLYATGSTACELLDLRRSDVHFRSRSISLFNRKYDSQRQIPIGRDLQKLLADFLQRRSPALLRTKPLLATRTGTFISPFMVTYSFSRLRRIAGVGSGAEDAPQPRLLDFRTTFAVHRIRAWIKEGAELNRMLPALATYLGQSGLGVIDKYMDLTPEGYADHMAILSSGKGGESWRG